MSNNVPWSINAVEPQTWDTAREAARRSGLSVGEWLEAAIRGNAGTERSEREFSRRGNRRADVHLQDQLDDISDRLNQMMERDEPRGRNRQRPESAILNSLDGLTDRIDALIAEIRSEDQSSPYQIKTAIDRLDSRLESLVTRSAPSREPEVERRLSELARQIETMDRRIEQENVRLAASPRTAPSIAELDAAIAEITVRQAALDDGAHSRDLDRRLAAIDQRFGFAPRTDLQLTGIEQQIKFLADEMQALRHASAHADAVDQLRREVGDLARKLGDLTPRRSINALERTVAGLARRIDRAPASEQRDNGDVVQALQEIHRSLAEVKPAESFKAVEHDLRALSEKLDGLNERGIDATTVNRLQTQTAEIRELLANALPGDTLKTLVDQIENLMRRLDHAPSPNEGALVDVVSSLERRIDSFAERVEAANREPKTSPLLDEIKGRLEQIESALSRGDRGVPGGLETTMNALLAKLDAAETRLAKLGTIEHGMNDLFGQMKEIRANALDVVERAAYMSVEAPLAPRQAEPRQAESRQVESRQVEPRQGEPKQAEPREPAPLTRIEAKPFKATRKEPEFAEASVSLPPAPRGEPRSIALDPETSTVTSSGEGDFPLEPGSGSPRRPHVSAAERVALSEAALGDMPTRQSAPASTSDYIAAARRAAQAAAAKQPETGTAASKPKRSFRLKLNFGANRRAVVLGLLFIVITFGAVRFGGLANMVPFLHSSNLKPEPLMKPKAPNATPERSVSPVESADPSESTPADDSQEHSEIEQPNFNVADIAAPKMVAPSATSSMLAAEIEPRIEFETTGSVPDTKTKSVSPSSTPHRPAELPAEIGPTSLRMAALAADPAAAFEIGNRWFEGRGVPADMAEAKRWFEIAFREGSMPAAYRLGNMYEKGFGTPKNIAEARRYYTQAAEAGNIKAMHNLAVLAAEGADGKPDYKLAARWFRIASDHNVRDSQYNLGVLYARGAGVERNFAESYRWFALAGAQGDSEAIKKRDEIAKRLDPQALATVKVAVQEWKPTPSDEQANEVKPRPEWEKAMTSPPARKKTAKR